MTDKAPVNAPAIAVLPLLLIWMAVLLPVYHPNMGGGGLALPQNILAWSVMALTTLIVTFTVCLGRTRLSLTPTARLLLLGIAVLALPLLYTRPEWREDALWRCAGLLGGWLFYIACLQLRLTARQRNLLLFGLLFAVGVQALLAALQLFAPALAWVSPNGSRVYGVFQQPNVLGSFIATGLALALWLLLAPLRRRSGGNSVARAAGRFLRPAGADPVARRLAGRCPGGGVDAVAFCPPAPGREPLGRRCAAVGRGARYHGVAHRFRSGDEYRLT